MIFMIRYVFVNDSLFFCNDGYENVQIRKVFSRPQFTSHSAGVEFNFDKQNFHL